MQLRHSCTLNSGRSCASDLWLVRIALGFSFLAAFARTLPAQEAYTVVDAGIPYSGTNGFFSLVGINNDGQIVGFSGTNGDDTAAFRWSPNSGFNDLGPLPTGAAESFPNGINDEGEIVGDLRTGSPFTSFIWTDQGGYQSLSNLATANSINDAGTIAGGNGNTACLLPQGASSTIPLFFPGGTSSTTACDINSRGVVVGLSTDITGSVHALVWPTPSTVEDLSSLPNGIGGAGSATAINDAGFVVGSVGASSNQQAYLWSASGGAVNLGTLSGAATSVASGLNSSNQVVGTSGNAGFVWNSQGGMVNLNAALASTSSGWTIGVADGINNSGQIAAVGTNFTGQAHVLLLTPHIVTIATSTAPTSSLIAPPKSNLGQLMVFDKATGAFDLNANLGNFINPGEPTIVLTHGWEDTPSSWAAGMASEMESLAQTPVNIVAWNWASAASKRFLPWVAVDTQVQGVGLATALQSALGTNYNSAIHFVGHSLGTLVNAEAINQYRAYNPGDLKIQDTLFDGAEVASGFAVSPIPTVPVAWIDNYISAFGNLYPQTANVVLEGGPTASDPVPFHSYPQQWYEQTMNINFLPAFGFQSDITQGGLNGQEPPANSYYIQNGSGLSLVQTNSTGAVLALSARDAVEDFTTIPSFIAFLLANDLASPVQTYNQCQVGITANGSVQVTLVKQANPTLSANVGKTSKAASASISAAVASNTSSTSSSYAWVPVTIPADAQYLSVDFTCQGLSPDDYFSLGIGDTLLFEAESQFVIDGVATNTGFLDVSQWSGQDVQLFLGLNASDDNNAGGTLVLNDIEFASVPEPATLYQFSFLTLCLIGQRRTRRRHFDQTA